MPLGANPLVNPTALDYVGVAGVANSGIARVLDADGRPYDWDKKNSSGSQGATQTYRGWDLAKFKVRYEFWLAEQIDYFENVYVPVLRYDALKQAPQPVAVYHPILASRDVHAAIVTRIGPLVDLGAQLWSVTVDFEEFRPPKKKNVTTTPDKGAKTDGKNGAQKPTVEDRLDARLVQLDNQWQRGLPRRRNRVNP